MAAWQSEQGLNESGPSCTTVSLSESQIWQCISVGSPEDCTFDGFLLVKVIPHPSRYVFGLMLWECTADTLKAATDLKLISVRVKVKSDNVLDLPVQHIFHTVLKFTVDQHLEVTQGWSFSSRR